MPASQSGWNRKKNDNEQQWQQNGNGIFKI